MGKVTEFAHAHMQANEQTQVQVLRTMRAGLLAFASQDCLGIIQIIRI